MPDTLNREDQIDERANEMFNNHPDLQNAEHEAGKNAGSHDSIDGYDRSTDGLDSREDNPSGFWKGKATADGEDKYIDMNKFQKAVGVAKKRGGPLGLLALFGVGGGMIAGLLGPATMIINLMENFSDTNDSSSTAMERRFLKVFKNATQSDLCKSKKIKCKTGRLSNSALRKLERKGIRPCADKKCNNPVKTRVGRLPKANPTAYNIDGKIIQAKDISGFLSQKENRHTARKVFGVGGAMNLRFRAWAGKHISSKLYKKFNLQRTGGLADGQNNKKMTPRERAKAAIEKLRGRIPTDQPDTGKIRSMLDKRLKTAKKGGPVYMASVVGCITVKIPRLIVVGVVAVQLAQIMPIIMDTILSPGGKAKASGATGEDLDTIGTMLTETTPREGDGKQTSALDSPILLSAMGVNTNRPDASQYAPGLGVMALPYIIGGIKAEKATESKCDKILSPEAMYIAAAITLAASSNPIGAFIKTVAGFVVGKIVADLVGGEVEKKMKEIFEHFAKNNGIPKARGQALGDVLGIGAVAFFSAGGMARSLPSLKKSQLRSYNEVQKENEQFNREMDIAALSPFDTSSKYTFMGSIVHNMKTAVATKAVESNGSPAFGSILLGGLGSLPSYAFSSQSASAATLSPNSCDYAEDFGINKDTAINIAGMPCTGITDQQANMSTSTATDLMLYEGWLDEDASTEDGDTIEDLLNSGYIKPDTPLADYINQCSNPDSGEYIVNAPSCAIDCVGSCTSGTSDRNSACITTQNEDGESVQSCGSDIEGYEESSVGEVKDQRSLAAIPVFLLDYQIAQSMNGEDEEEEDSGETTADSTLSPSVALGDVTFPLKGTKSVVKNPGIFTNGTTSKGGHPYTAYDIYADAGTEVLAFAEGTVTGLHDSSSLGKGVSVYNETAGIVVYYTHMANVSVAVNDTIKPGDVLGKLASVNTYPAINVDHLHIDASTDRIRGSCSRSGCSIKSHFRSIGTDLFNTYKALPD